MLHIQVVYRKVTGYFYAFLVITVIISAKALCHPTVHSPAKSTTSNFWLSRSFSVLSVVFLAVTVIWNKNSISVSGFGDYCSCPTWLHRHRTFWEAGHGVVGQFFVTLGRLLNLAKVQFAPCQVTVALIYWAIGMCQVLFIASWVPLSGNVCWVSFKM